MSSKNTDRVSGRIKEAAGAISGNDDLKNEGKRDQLSADIKGRVEDAVDSVKKALGGDGDKKKKKKKDD